MSHAEERAHTRQFSLRLGERGRIVLPAEVRKELGLEPDERLLLTVEDDGSMRLTTVRAAVRSLRGMLRELLPDFPEDVSLVDELIAERRREAAREDARE